MNIRTLLAHIKYCLAKKLWKYAPYIKNDKLYIRIKYLLFLNKWCNLKHPKTFCEKLQWLKLHDHKPIYHQMVDKAEAKKFIADRVGGEYVIPTIGVWDRFEDIDFDVLPNEFILKNTHDSGTYCVCTDKTTLNINKVKERMSVTWNIDYSVYSREWPYKGVKSRIIAEPLLRDSDSPFLTDYKFFTFNGEPKFYYTTSNRGKEGGLKEDFFDIEGKLLPFTQKGYPNNPRIPSLPVNLLSDG